MKNVQKRLVRRAVKWSAVLGLAAMTVMAFSPGVSADYFIKRDQQQQIIPVPAPQAAEPARNQYWNTPPSSKDATAKNENAGTAQPGAGDSDNADSPRGDHSRETRRARMRARLGLQDCSAEDMKTYRYLKEGQAEIDRTIANLNFSKRAKEMLEFLKDPKNVQLMSDLAARCGEYDETAATDQPSGKKH